jgi:hypothetical protein
VEVIAASGDEKAATHKCIFCSFLMKEICDWSRPAPMAHRNEINCGESPDLIDIGIHYDTLPSDIWKGKSQVNATGMAYGTSESIDQVCVSLVMAQALSTRLA